MEKYPEKGGCQGTVFLGIYYEKVINKQLTVICLLFIVLLMIIVYEIEMYKT